MITDGKNNTTLLLLHCEGQEKLPAENRARASIAITADIP